MEPKRLVHRQRYYPLVQSVMAFTADQQLIIGVSLLVAGIRHLTDSEATIYHIDLIRYLVTLCNICFIGAVEFLERPLEKDGSSPDHFPLEGSGSGPNLRIVLSAFFMVLQSVYWIMATALCCRVWGEDNSRNCYQQSIYASLFGCYPSLLFHLVWLWGDYLYVLNRRFVVVRTFMGAIRTWFQGNTDSLRKTKDAERVLASEVFQAIQKSATWLRSLLPQPPSRILLPFQ